MYKLLQNDYISNIGDTMYYLNTFLLYSILGHCFETIIFFITKSHKKSGFMFLWWTPFYGIGVILSLLIYKYINNKINNKLLKNIILFLIYFVSFSILEFLGGFIIEKIYHYSMWNYRKLPLNIGKYISIPTSLLWSFMALIYIYFIKRYLDRLIIKIPKYLTIIISIIFFLDLLCSLLKIIN